MNKLLKYSELTAQYMYSSQATWSYLIQSEAISQTTWSYLILYSEAIWSNWIQMWNSSFHESIASFGQSLNNKVDFRTAPTSIAVKQIHNTILITKLERQCEFIQLFNSKHRKYVFRTFLSFKIMTKLLSFSCRKYIDKKPMNLKI